jgi:hypothetical protein
MVDWIILWEFSTRHRCLRKPSINRTSTVTTMLIEIHDCWSNYMTVDWIIWLLIELYDGWLNDMTVDRIIWLVCWTRHRRLRSFKICIFNHDIPFGELRARVASLSVYSIMIFNSRGWPASGGGLGRDGGMVPRPLATKPRHRHIGYDYLVELSSERTRHVHCWCSAGEQPGVVNEWMITFDSVSAPWHRRVLKERRHLI